MKWTLLHPKATPAHLGYIPGFLKEEDPRPAAEQFRERYVGGWHPFAGFKMTGEGLEYPGDPPMPAVAALKFRDEWIYLYAHAWVAIVQPDGTYEVSRMD